MMDQVRRMAVVRLGGNGDRDVLAIELVLHKDESLTITNRPPLTFSDTIYDAAQKLIDAVLSEVKE